MSSNHEEHLWKELKWRDFVIATFVVIILAVLYFWIYSMNPNEQSMWSIARELALAIIPDLIPVFLLFAGSYVLLRRTQQLWSKKETDELTSKISSRVADMVKSELGTLREAAKADQATAIVEGSLIIKSAKYGAEGHYNDVTDRVRSAISAGKVKMRVDNDFFGPDPIKTVPKKVIVEYVYAGREGYSKTVPENADLIFSTLK